MIDWYAQNLGLATNGYGASFEWRQADDPTKEGTTAWSPFPENTNILSHQKRIL